MEAPATPAPGNDQQATGSSARGLRAKPKERRAGIVETPSPKAAQLFADENATLTQRFVELADRAANGDLAATHLAAQIANECHSVVSLPPGTPPVGREEATPEQASALEQARDECKGLRSAPGFARIQALMKDRPVEAFDVPIKVAIREQFADAGSKAALDVAVSALRARPDAVTVRVVAGELSQLDISVFLGMEGQFQSVASLNPAQRQKVLLDAFELLSCDFGNPCGPDSFAVRMACFGMGVCVPGADLQSLYEQELLSGQERRDVFRLLNYLRRIHPTMVSRWE